ncbi:hypothetical protein [Bradyrhizobium zhanjiangense]|uniref:hypothetical protein n=1 Tax=Bradyrhizobium zhanjiangense TaxID=1325107 RepID=UPI0013E8D560|nr:hypothetical protein [Bradyrhizobium zhanjiangense]
MKVKQLCFGCVGDRFLSDEIHAKGKRFKCSYCGAACRSYAVADVVKRVSLAFDQHYFRTSDQPNDYEHMLLRDRELSYEWDRHGEPVVNAIMNAAEIPEAAAQDIQAILEDEHEDFDSGNG